MVHDQAASAFIPGLGAFDYPPFGQYNKAFDVSRNDKQVRLFVVDPAPDVPIGGVPDNLHVDPMMVRDHLRALPRIA